MEEEASRTISSLQEAAKKKAERRQQERRRGAMGSGAKRSRPRAEQAKRATEEQRQMVCPV